MSPSVFDHCSDKPQKLSRGFSLLEAVVVLTVTLSLMCLGAQYVGQRTNDLLNQTAAQQLNRVATAANHYAHDHFESLQSSTSNTKSVIWNSPEIKQFLYEGGYLPKTLRDHNPYNQTYQIVIQQPQPNLLQLLVLTQGGQIINEGGLRQVSQWAGPTGGYISQRQPNQATGGQEGWQIPLSGSVMTTPGHLAALNYLNSNDVLSASSLLFRKKIAGHPEYNRMEADLKMAADIELEDGSKIWFNQGSDRSTVIEGGSITLTHGQDSLTLRPERLVVNTAQGIAGYRGIETNSHVVAAGDVDAGRDLTAKNSITAGKDITAAGVLYAQKLEVKDKIKTWSAEITPAEIRLESQASGNKSYVGNDYIKFSTSIPKDRSVANGVWLHGGGTNEEVSFSADSLHIPYYLTNLPSSGWTPFSEVIYPLCYKEDEKNRIGKLFFINSTNYDKPYLILCGHDGKIYIENGFSRY